MLWLISSRTIVYRQRVNAPKELVERYHSILCEMKAKVCLSIFLKSRDAPCFTKLTNSWWLYYVTADFGSVLEALWVELERGENGVLQGLVLRPGIFQSPCSHHQGDWKSTTVKSLCILLQWFTEIPVPSPVHVWYQEVQGGISRMGTRCRGMLELEHLKAAAHLTWISDGGN